MPLIGALPPFSQLMFDAEVVEHPRNKCVDQLRDGLRLRVERWAGGNNRGSGFGEGYQIAQVDQVIRRLAGNQD